MVFLDVDTTVFLVCTLQLTEDARVDPLWDRLGESETDDDSDGSSSDGELYADVDVSVESGDGEESGLPMDNDEYLVEFL